jgi:hypothetical protein
MLSPNPGIKVYFFLIQEEEKERWIAARPNGIHCDFVIAGI